MTIKEEIKQALEQLGYKFPDISIFEIGINCYRVKLNAEYIGIWDSRKKTFVD